jgi:hypothetical protein
VPSASISPTQDAALTPFLPLSLSPMTPCVGPSRIADFAPSFTQCHDILETTLFQNPLIPPTSHCSSGFLTLLALNTLVRVQHTHCSSPFSPLARCDHSLALSLSSPSSPLAALAQARALSSWQTCVLIQFGLVSSPHVVFTGWSGPEADHPFPPTAHFPDSRQLLPLSFPSFAVRW